MLNKNSKPIESILVQPLINIRSRAIVETAIATTIAIIVPAILAHTPNNQFIVGPIVNAILFWVAFRVGLTNALFIAIIPSLMAIFRGMLPPNAALIVPFIILGNCVMILTFYSLKTKLWLRVVASSVLKSLTIFLPVFLFLNSSPAVTFMMSWPQLATAFVGGAIFILINKILCKVTN